MARGRKAKTSAASGKRKIKEEADEAGPATKLQRADSENTQIRKAAAEAVSSEASAGSSKSAPLDNYFGAQIGVANGRAHKEYACMLNQTDVINNNNKFYVIQMAKVGKKFHVFNRWGRVGETGQMSLFDFTKEDEAVKAFCKKFTDKTGNKWEARNKFVPKPKKYTLLAMDVSEDDDAVDSGAPVKKEVKTEAGDVLPSSLDPRTQLAIQLLFSQNMFEAQMTEMNLDIRKMPLGKLSKAQIAKGLSALVDIEDAVKNKESYDKIANLTSRFYTLIPHSFGRMTPPVLTSLDVIRQKKDVMLTLSDIELTQSLQKTDKGGSGEKIKNPLDEQYESLKCDMTLVPSTAQEFKVISRYIRGTTPSGWKLRDVWRLDRAGEADRFSVNDCIKERKLLWHGTNVAVVAAILNSGLRIMPHSGGLVGRGIYFASEHSKSSGYTSGHWGVFSGEKNARFMFLVEVALGKSHEIRSCDSSLTQAPPGFNSVVARGRNEPDPKQDVKLKLDGREVIVPVGKPVPQSKFKNSNFWQSEYLVYNEHQARLRFLLKFID